MSIFWESVLVPFWSCWALTKMDPVVCAVNVKDLQISDYFLVTAVTFRHYAKVTVLDAGLPHGELLNTNGIANC